jgi:hypothetical protein
LHSWSPLMLQQGSSTSRLWPGTGPLSYRKKNLLGHGLIKVENHWPAAAGWTWVCTSGSILQHVGSWFSKFILNFFTPHTSGVFFWLLNYSTNFPQFTVMIHLFSHPSFYSLSPVILVVV